MPPSDAGKPGNDPASGSANGERQCNLLQTYLKDLSFEAPRVPGILFGHRQPGLQFDVSNHYSLCVEASAKLGEIFAVEVRVRLEARTEDQPLFLIEATQGGLFELKGYPLEEKDYVLRTRAVEMIYPWARELVSSLVGRAGFPRIQMRAVDFEARYNQAMQEYLAATEGSGSGG